MALLLVSTLMAGCGGKGDGPTPTVTASPAGDNDTEHYIPPDLLEQMEKEAAEEAAAAAEERAKIAIYPDDFTLNKTELPFEFELAAVADYGALDIGQSKNPGRVDRVVASSFLRPVADEAYWTVVKLVASPTTYLTIQALNWTDANDTDDALGLIGLDDGRCYWPDETSDTIRGVYRNQTTVLWLGYDLAQVEYAKLLLSKLEDKSNLTEICPLSYDDEIVDEQLEVKIAWGISEAADKFTVTQPPVSVNWSRISIDSSSELFARVGTGTPVHVPADEEVALVGSKMAANDALELCATQGLANVQVKLLADGEVSQRYTFLVVDHKSWC